MVCANLNIELNDEWTFVLILILLEYGLRPILNDGAVLDLIVLILILLEYGLRRGETRP